jgi:tetratricopeptide (TPR) repeat protein
MALKSITLELGRKRLAQSEEEYMTTINMNDKDSYGYQGIAELYIDWAEKTTDIDEETLYLSKAEEILIKGLPKVSDKETIWIELSKIDQYLSDTPGQIEKLRKAISLAPESPMAKYLLAKTLSSNREYEEAIRLFKEAFQIHPQNYRNSIEYAKAIVLHSNGSESSIKEAIAILQQSTLNGYSDPYFISTLGGLLFLDKQFTESEAVFNESRRRELQYIFIPLFTPSCWSIKSDFTGVVKYVGGGYSKILLDGYTEVSCASSKVNDIILRRSMKVTVVLKFNMRGPIAYITSF